MKVRHKIKIGYLPVTLKFVKKVDKDDSHGEYDYSKATIKIKIDQNSVQLGNTVLHEIMHGIFHDKDLGLDRKTEEKIVNAITNGIVEFVQVNPKFWNKLMRLLKPDKSHQ